MQLTVAARDERRHPPGPQVNWGESWLFEFAAPDASLGGFVRLGLYPNRGVAWFWAYLAGRDGLLVAVRDHGVELPRTRSLEVRSEGLWSAINCETPLDHWTVGLEAFAVSMEQPMDALRGELGERIAFGLDLEWEAAAPAVGYPTGSGLPEQYGQACRVHGAVLLGRDSIELDGHGHREHSWGVLDWWAQSRTSLAGRLSDGTFLHGLAMEESKPSSHAAGYLVRNGVVDPVEGIAIDVELNANGLAVSARGELDGLHLSITVLGVAPVPLEGPEGRQARLVRALCWLESADGRSGPGWAEWLQQRV